MSATGVLLALVFGTSQGRPEMAVCGCPSASALGRVKLAEISGVRPCIPNE